MLYFFPFHCRCSILELFELNHCKNERPILQILKQHPYIVNIVSSFQDVRIIYFLMDYYPGGNLMRLLSLGKLSVSHARQITAQVRLSPPTPIRSPSPPRLPPPSCQLTAVKSTCARLTDFPNAAYRCPGIHAQCRHSASRSAAQQHIIRRAWFHPRL